ncbi:hypothetical protein NAL32_21305 [Chryseobacterium sp. Ch-15]|uniref:Uncharacterized protein n=1 Tax=Chryseobacterium muglaense TaxID=2893752 RepID=A0A9Q3UPG4_9FLAO|nr:hypothetical protein [Chryseobacterium muglaense]MBD3907267.1 hypothetical protein [Chryseobacterium muglaense]MCC9033028.1 hypothetical protein [Chryseobacterium muglaense]MCM2556931.1 hypothetical protein [Chryseobacterium muglaense]
MSNKKIGLAPYHIPTVAAGEYNIAASLKNNLEQNVTQEIKFGVAGYNASIPQNEVLAVYPPREHTGNFAGTFPHIQFRRSTLPWEYKVNQTDSHDKRFPYIFLVLLKEKELNDFQIITTDTNQLEGSTESPDEPKPLKIIKHNNSELFPKADLIKNLAHVRVQEHTEIKNLNLPKETSILVSHRMVEPNTKYRAFVCYYAKEMTDKYKMITDTVTHPNSCVILNEWSFESIGADLYQIDKDKLKNHPAYNIFNENLKDSEIDTLEEIKKHAKPELISLIGENQAYLKERDENWENWKNKDDLKGFEEQEKDKKGNNHILEYLQYNGKNLKGYLHELELQPFKTFLKKKVSGTELVDYPSQIKNLLDIAKVPLEHQLKAGGKMVSWYQGPFTNGKILFDILGELNRKGIKDVPNHQDYLNLFNEDTGMYDMTYSVAWQLGRLMIMNDNKVLQELKKWKYEIEIYNLVKEQNELNHLPNLKNNKPVISDLLMNYVTELIQFRNFPLYYLLPHADLSTEESIKYFKIDNSWILAFLFGIFSSGPTLRMTDFENYILKEKKLESIFNKVSEYYGILLQTQTIKNWPHLVVELGKLHDVHYVTTINSTLRLYITDEPFSSVEMYLKNENAHFGIIYKDNKAKTITIDGNEDSTCIANKYLWKQPRVVLNLK